MGGTIIIWNSPLRKYYVTDHDTYMLNKNILRLASSPGPYLEINRNNYYLLCASQLQLHVGHVPVRTLH